jgi:hypothetical protein
MIESTVFIYLKDLGHKNHVNLNQSKNLLTFFIYVGLISTLIRPCTVIFIKNIVIF